MRCALGCRGYGCVLFGYKLRDAPHVDSRREAGQLTPIGTSTPNRVAICVLQKRCHFLTEEIQKLASKSECALPTMTGWPSWSTRTVGPVP